MLRAAAAMLCDESASTLVEYGLIVALCSAGATIVLLGIAASANGLLASVSSNMQSFQTAPPP